MSIVIHNTAFNNGLYLIILLLAPAICVLERKRAIDLVAHRTHIVKILRQKQWRRFDHGQSRFVNKIMMDRQREHAAVP